jgi:hypothetical protein
VTSRTKSAATVVGNSSDGCEFCKGAGHVLNSCFAFKRKPLKDRRNFIWSRRLCFSCLEIGHNIKDCKNRATCEEANCGRDHATVLHDVRLDQRSSNSDIAGGAGLASGAADREVVSSTQVKQHRIALPIVLVKVRVRGTKKSVTTYAALDSLSTSTFG